MTDYTKSTGTLGTLIIRDTGGNRIEFLIKNNSAPTYINNLRWTGTVNGKAVSGTKQISGKGTYSLGAWTVTTNQTVTLAIPATGTQGLGGPTSFSKAINRATKPPAPTQSGYTNITHTSATLKFVNNGTGGSPILEWQTSFGTNGTAVEGTGNKKYTSSGTLNLTGLQPGTRYHAWTRGRNANGWGPWSKVASFTTLAGVKIKVSGKWKNAVPYVKVSGTWKPALPYIKVSNAWKSTTS